jgi:hypothetical protein
MEELAELSTALIRRAKRTGVTIVVAESCTAGLMSHSGIFLRSILSAMRGGIGAALAYCLRDGSGRTSQNTPPQSTPMSRAAINT